eukprot:a187116_25.p1 GENE.a187116_25~~a187116_25.p1  ORF type:complete len:144 (-),score=43.58 a187116_25:252-635(-)
MTDTGARVLCATSTDENCPAENALTRDLGTFFATTGLFPQEIVFGLGEQAGSARRMRTWTTNVKAITIYGVELASGAETVLAKAQLPFSNGGMQIEVHALSSAAKTIRLVLESGFDDFASVHRVEFE